MKGSFENIKGISFFKSEENESYYLVKDEETLNRLFQEFKLNNSPELMDELWSFDTELSLELREKMISEKVLFALKHVTPDILLYYFTPHGGCFSISLKYLMPFKKKVKLNIDGIEHEYFMTNDENFLAEKLEQLHIPLPPKDKLRPNPALSKIVIDKMKHLGALYSLTKYESRYILNYYKAGDVPYIVFLKRMEKDVGD